VSLLLLLSLPLSHLPLDWSVRPSKKKRKTQVYVCDIDGTVTEAELAALFSRAGQIVDCRVCGDPNSAMRFAFVEFREAGSVRNAIALTGTVVGAYPLRVR